jgi:hypothetical protein
VCSGDLVGDPAGGLLRHVSDHDGRALGREAMGHVPPEPGPASGHYDHPPSKSHCCLLGTLNTPMIEHNEDRVPALPVVPASDSLAA